MDIPKNILNIISAKCGILDDLGQSGASVYLFEDMVLKVQSNGPETDNEYRMMTWLEGKLPVPKVIEYSKANKLSYLLMSRCPGEAACSDALMRRPLRQSELLADAIRQIWSIDQTECPSMQTLDVKLRRAEYNVINGLVDVNNCEPETFGSGGFKNPESLLTWLTDNKPHEELVLSHGDLCLPNIFCQNEKLSGLIDLGRMGQADKWCDIALCYRSLKNNYNGRYTGKQISGYHSEDLFDALQIQPDWERIRYYILLDELF